MIEGLSRLNNVVITQTNQLKTLKPLIHCLCQMLMTVLKGVVLLLEVKVKKQNCTCT